MNKTIQIIIVVVVIAVAFFGFQMYFVSNDSGSATITAEKAKANAAIDLQAQIILAKLNRLNKVKLDTDIFTNEVFVSLTLKEVDLEVQNSGRIDPFLPIGVEDPSSILRSTSTKPK